MDPDDSLMSGTEGSAKKGSLEERITILSIAYHNLAVELEFLNQVRLSRSVFYFNSTTKVSKFTTRLSSFRRPILGPIIRFPKTFRMFLRLLKRPSKKRRTKTSLEPPKHQISLKAKSFLSKKSANKIRFRAPRPREPQFHPKSRSRLLLVKL